MQYFRFEKNGECVERRKPLSFFTTAEVAEILKLEVRTIQLWIQSGRLKAHQFGRKYRIRSEDLDDFLEEHRTKSVETSITEKAE